MREIYVALKGYIESQRPWLDYVLTRYSMKLGPVFDWEMEVIDVGQFPLITLGAGSMQRKWFANNLALMIRYQIEINGYILHDDNELNAHAIQDFAEVFPMIFEPALLPANNEYSDQAISIINESTGLPQPYYITYDDEVPISDLQLGYQYIGDAFCRSFTCTWVGYVQRQATITPFVQPS
jgi:hypothetical protein